MISKFSLVDIIQSLKNPKHLFKTLDLEFNVENGDFNYVRRESYIFRVRVSGVKCLLKFYKDYSLDKVAIDRQTIRLASEMGDSPFSNAKWLPDEFCFTYNNKRELCDVVVYESDAEENFEHFLLTVHASDNKRISTQKFISFINALKWLVTSRYVVDKLSIDSFFIDENFEVKINVFDVDIKDNCSDEEYNQFYKQIAYVLKSSLQLLISYGVSDEYRDVITTLDTANKDTLLSLFDKISSLEFISCNVDDSSECCFNNPKYIVTNDRDENRIIVVCEKTGLKGFASYDGMLVTNCIYDEVLNYVEGYAVAQLNGQTGVIDKNNRIIIDFVWDWVEYENLYNLFIVEKDGLRSILNRKLEEISKEKFKFVGAFVDGYSIVLTQSGKSGVINQNCDYVLEPIYDDIKYCQLKEFEVVFEGQKEKINM